MGQTFIHRLRYEEWVRAHAPELHRYAYRLAGDHQVAEDIMQETFLEAWRCVDRQSEPGRARAWLFQILRYRYAHYCRDTKRQRKVLPLMEKMEDHPPDRGRAALDALGDKDAIQIALDTLSIPLRETFVTVFVEGRTCREAAEILKIPMGTVLSRLDSARRSLRAAMGEEGEDRVNRPVVKQAGERSI